MEMGVERKEGTDSANNSSSLSVRAAWEICSTNAAPELISSIFLARSSDFTLHAWRKQSADVECEDHYISSHSHGQHCTGDHRCHQTCASPLKKSNASYPTCPN